jgi:hypothetical protein
VLDSLPVIYGITMLMVSNWIPRFSQLLCLVLWWICYCVCFCHLCNHDKYVMVSLAVLQDLVMNFLEQKLWFLDVAARKMICDALYCSIYHLVCWLCWGAWPMGHVPSNQSYHDYLLVTLTHLTQANDAGLRLFYLNEMICLETNPGF